MAYQHLIFYDGQCGLCDRAVQAVLKMDKKCLFAFAPLQGKTAEGLLKDVDVSLRSADSVILIEDYQTSHNKIYIRSKAVFRICWLIGGGCCLAGWLSFFPAWLFDWGYRIVAANRHRLFKSVACVLPDPNQKERFLP